MEFLILILILLVIGCLNGQQSFSTVCQSGIREDNTNYIYCARRGLTEVPLFNKNNVVYDELVLSDNKIVQLNQNSFSRIKVKKVYLNGNPIRNIDVGSFSKLENSLEELWLDADTSLNSEYDLDQSTIVGLPKAIQNLRNLNNLRLKGFMVKRLDSVVLKRLNRIEVLSLQFCSIESIDKYAFEGLKTSLKELYLDGNLLQYVPTEALLTASFKNLKVLSLSQNNIKNINFDSFGVLNQLSGLFKLDLSYNGLKSIDINSFNSFNSTLESLLLQNNEINSYNLKFLLKLENLKDLNLDFNLINKLDKNLFSKSNKLQYLSLQGNTIQFDSESEQELIFYGLNNLQRLNMARNGIKRLPDGLFRPLVTLKSLILDKNLIDNLNEFTFDGLYSSLMNISLQNLKLKSQNLISLKNFLNLERIKLGFNEFESIDFNLFDKSCLSLSFIDLQSNRINQLINSTSSMDNLIELDLTNNKLCDFNSNLLLKLPKLKNLGLSQNPLYCDCNLKYLYDWVRVKYDRDMLNYIQWQCELPDEFNPTKRPKKFTSLSEQDFKCGAESKCHKQLIKFAPPSTPAPLSTESHSLVAEPVQISRISSINLKPLANNVLVSWELDTQDLDLLNNQDVHGFKITYSKSNVSDLSTILVDKSLRSFKLENLMFGSKYTVCVSMVRTQGYDKYCRDVEIESDTKLTIESTTKKFLPKQTSQSYLLNQITNSEYLGPGSSILSGLMISLLIVLVFFILFLITFLYFYIKKCRLNQKNLKKSLYNSTLMTNNSNTMRRAVYTGPVLTSTVEHKHKIDINSDQSNKCCCVLGQNTINNQRFIGYSLGKALQIGDTSTVSSTLSSVNNNLNLNPNHNGDVVGLSPNSNEWRFKPSQPIAVMTTGEVNTTTPSSFTHFIIQPNTQQIAEHTYMPYELYSYQDPNSGSLILPGSNQVQYLNNKNSQKIILSSNPNNDHVYCEIPSTIGRSGFKPNCVLNQATITNSQCPNSSASLLLSSSSSSSNSSSPQSNNTKFNNASII